MPNREPENYDWLVPVVFLILVLAAIVWLGAQIYRESFELISTGLFQ